MLSLASDHYTRIVGVPGQKCFMLVIFSSASKSDDRGLFFTFTSPKEGNPPLR